MQLGQIMGDDNKKEMDQIEDYLFSLFKPKKYNGSDGLEVSTVNAFEDMCFIIGREISENPKYLSTLTFYRSLENIKNMNKSK